MHAFYHKLGKTLNTPSMEAKCTEANHEDFSRDCIGVMVRGKGGWNLGKRS